jgi:catechol 2,3-dioxygenase-like lactoylglutathione lyase family enzyme
MAGMNITHVRLLSVPVTDQDRAKDFYLHTLGFDLLADNPMGPAQRWVQVGPKGGATSITLVTWFESMPAGSLTGLVLETDDLDGDIERLRAAGVEFDGPEEAPWGRYVTLADPDGNKLVLTGPPTP